MAQKEGNHERPVDQNGFGQGPSKKRRKSIDRQAPRRPSRRTLMLTRLEALLWILGAAGVVYYGDGKHNLPHLVLRDPRMRRSWLYAGIGLLVLNLFIYLYILIWVRYVKCETDGTAAPVALACGTFSGLAALLVFCVAAWRIWGFFTPLVLIVLYMAFFMVSPLVSLLASSPEDPKTA